MNRRCGLESTHQKIGVEKETKGPYLDHSIREGPTSGLSKTSAKIYALVTTNSSRHSKRREKFLRGKDRAWRICKRILREICGLNTTENDVSLLDKISPIRLETQRVDMQ